MADAQLNADSPSKIKSTVTGVVVSDKRDKSRTVRVAYTVKHPKYGKYLNRRQKFQVHDAENESAQGDRVEITSCNPVSKTKSWTIVRVVEKAAEVNLDI